MSPEPKTAEELLARYADVRRRIYGAPKVVNIAAKPKVLVVVEPPRKMTTKERILALFCLRTGLSAEIITSDRMQKHVVLVRQACCYWMVRRTTSSLVEIGAFLGNRDHTTIRHAIRSYPVKRGASGRNLRPVRSMR
ncbi:hypothetical protein L905_19005 [Agrobacterium sp. TS43]|uniref:helix-turn-helix domain-containing protein n=1 Tax=Agrobacterium TaxID=357 RepID=UPI0004A046D8|nr:MULTISPECIES: helix-turn-helix domain-containing protein [Agrobacterium]KDR87690.1 hypothetical protein K538_06960 [Agrobacterium tumefaciens GW4]KVK49480.1 hypothetical protein L903_19355 [Agrobacterium sp. JL28]KVK49717.1 hypothetical protein L904_19345 [Agrobacterium sp. LY4]KVK62660.1 hypothetical protein L906_18480 [Agrobacterium sp. TS45]KVK65045.1 hypothetical protein L905_19005 [Agrobacterium sp. TS43]